MTFRIALAVLALPVHAPAQEPPDLPSPADVVRVTVDLRFDSPVRPVGVRTRAGEVVALLTRYEVVEPVRWTRDYSHVAGLDRGGRIVLADRTELEWLLRPGGLGRLTLPDGREVHLYRGAARPVPIEETALRIEYDGIEPLLEAAVDGDTDARATALHRLALLEDNDEGREVLLRTVADREAPPVVRQFAAMGLGNYRSTMSDADAVRTGRALISILTTDGEAAPDDLVRAALRFDDPAAVRDALGEALTGHPVEVEVLAAVADARSHDRLLEIRRGLSDLREPAEFDRAFAVARALTAIGDEAGVDLAMELLRIRRDLPLGYGHNVYLFVRGALGPDFVEWLGAQEPADADAAMDATLAWWKENAAEFALETRPR